MSDYKPGIYQIDRPPSSPSLLHKEWRGEGPVPATPLVFDSPHSGSIYPDDFNFACAPDILYKAEDTFVDDLFSSAPLHGAPLLRAFFPRSYIDANRAENDIDPGLLDERWPEPLARDGRSGAGHGLIRRLLRPGYEIYDRKLSVAEIRRRIDTCYTPYHTALAALLDETYAAHGQVWHINCHSMPSSSAYASPAKLFRPLQGNQVDIVLGNRDGTTCDPAFVQEVRAYLMRLGYRVSINNPYKGVELLRRYASPVHHRHSLQIEISKALYLDEEKNTRAPGYAALKADLEKLIIFMRDYITHLRFPQAAD